MWMCSSGPYGALHLPTEMLLRAAGGLRMRHLPTTGGGPALTALLGGHAQVLVSTVGVAAPQIKAGKARPLATFGATRLAHLPDVPTLKELGYDVEFYVSAGLFAPRGTPANVVKALREAVRQAVQHADFEKAMDNAARDRLPGRGRVQGVVGPGRAGDRGHRQGHRQARAEVGRERRAGSQASRAPRHPRDRRLDWLRRRRACQGSHA